MKNLLVNGCSFTAGSHPSTLPSPENHISSIVWPRHLEDKFENVYNLAKGGTGNDRILRTTIDFCEGTDMSDYVVIIQWSSPFRTEYWNPEDNEWINVVVRNGMEGDWSIDVPSDPNTARKKLQTLSYQNEMKWLNSLSDYNIAYYNNVVVLQNYFENNNISYMFTCMTSPDHPFMEKNIYNIIPTTPDTLKHYMATIPTTTEINLNKLMDKRKWSQLSLTTYADNNPISQEDQHPNLKGNKLIAQALYKELMEKYGR